MTPDVLRPGESPSGAGGDHVRFALQPHPNHLTHLTVIKQFLTLAAVAGASTLSAQVVDLQVNPIGALFGNVTASAEFPISENFGVEPNVGFLLGNTKVAGTEYSRRGVSAGVNGKYYFNPDEDISRFYGMAYTRFKRSRQTLEQEGFDDSEFKRTRLAVGAGIGYKVVARSGFLLEVAIGGGRSIVNNFDYGDEFADDAFSELTQFDLLGRLSVGYRLGN